MKCRNGATMDVCISSSTSAGRVMGSVQHWMVLGRSVPYFLDLCANLLQAHRFLRQTNSHQALNCHECTTFSWLHLCLHCVYVGCFAKGDNHILQHKEKTGHFLSLETAHYQVYCGLCRDYIYDSEFHQILEEERCDSLC